MNDARAMLNSLMGENRNEAPGKDKRKKKDQGNIGGFKHESVCKLWLAGFCPEHDELFYNTKRDLGKCPKTHYEMHMEEYNAHPQKKKYQAAYELQLLTHLGKILRETKDITAREKIKYEQYLQRERAKPQQPVEDSENPKVIASQLLAEAEDLASKGDFDGSKRKISEAKVYEEKAKEWEENSGPPDVADRICDICGERKNNEKKSAFKHEAGRVHQGTLYILKKHAELKEKEETGKLKVDRDIVKEEEELKERDAKEKRAREREAREREREERRAKEERERKEREEREREAREREAKEREAREKEAREREDRGKRRRDASRSPRGGRRKADDSGSPGRGRRRDSPEDGKKKRPRSGSPDKVESETQQRNKKRFVEKQFMDLLVAARLNPEDTYEDIEERLGRKDQWTDCPVETRKELTAAFLGAIKNIR